MDASLRWLLVVFFVAYIGMAFVGRSVIVWRQTGVNPITFRGTGSVHDFVGMLFRFTLMTAGLSILLHAAVPDIDSLLIPIVWLDHPQLRLVGFSLLVISFIWTIIAQTQMGNSWRIGIDPDHHTRLIRTGLFRFSRNPIFLGMRITLLGLFLVMPAAITLTIFALGDVLMQIQVRLEEEFLAKVHPGEYDTYRQATRRWL